MVSPGKPRANGTANPPLGPDGAYLSLNPPWAYRAVPLPSSHSDHLATEPTAISSISAHGSLAKRSLRVGSSGVNKVQCFFPIAQRATHDDERIFDEAIHKRRMVCPPGLFTDRPPAVPV